MVRSSDRTQQLIAGRRAGTVTLKEFKRQIETFWPEELAELAAALLEERPQKRQRLKQKLLAGLDELPPCYAPVLQRVPGKLSFGLPHPK